MNIPQAKKIEKILEKHGDRRSDPYFWMNERENPEVTAYLESENEYADFVMKDTEQLQEELFREMKARYKKDDESIPYFFNGYWYIVRYEKGKEYPIFCRKHLTLENPEEVMLDANELAQGYEYFDLGSAAASPDNRLGAYSTDTVGRRIYTIQIKNLNTGEVLADIIENCTGKAVWSADNQYIFYIRKDENLRAYKVFRHKIGTTSQEDAEVYHEKDEAFDVHVYKTKSLEYLFIGSSSTLSDEHRFISANNPLGEWKILQPRADELEYSVEHFADDFYIITNADDAFNFKLVITPVSTPGIENWTDIVPHSEDVLLEGFEIFRNFLVVEERKEGLLQLKVTDTRNAESHYLPFSDPTYTAFISLNLEFDTDKLRYGYTSLTQPTTAYEYDMGARTTTLLKQQEVLGGNFSPENYISERLWAKSRDGETMIPVSVVYHKNTPKSPETPLLMYGYGSYGHTVDAGFSNVRLSLLDRGFTYAIAHIRGGEYLGREWYEEGRMLEKKNTFYDFIDVAKYLISSKYTSPTHLYGMGGSAGGLLVGAVINFEPQLFNGVIAQVPFVDVVTTMLDETIPLTAGEYDEWGNPSDSEYYHYMKSYSPYDNVEAKAYPNMLITTGLHDSQVQYWEPAKWTAKLRELKTDNNILIFKTDMSSGHGGASGRFESLKEDALEFAFLLKLEKKNNEQFN